MKWKTPLAVAFVWTNRLTCSITSGAIQHGVPTNVFRTLFLVISPPAARNALTPKSVKNNYFRNLNNREDFRKITTCRTFARLLCHSLTFTSKSRSHLGLLKVFHRSGKVNHVNLEKKNSHLQICHTLGISKQVSISQYVKSILELQMSKADTFQNNISS